MSIRDKYVFVTTRNEDMQCIGIKEGPFAGVVYKYGKVSFAKEEDENGNLPMQFHYDIVDNNGKIILKENSKKLNSNEKLLLNNIKIWNKKHILNRKNF